MRKKSPVPDINTDPVGGFDNTADELTRVIGHDNRLLDRLPNFIGRSREFLAALTLLDTFASAHAPILIRGETGTGKELAAHSCHYLGPRRGRPYIPVSCATFPDNLIGSELFGYDKGAFTDAKQARAGLVSQAEGGTLFLDEVDSLSLKAQAALLRFLQERTYRPLGAGKERSANVQIIAASNTNMDALVKAGHFRKDLYYRLHVAHVYIPPLRKRRSDIPLLARHFLNQFNQQYQRGPRRLSDSTLNWLIDQPWPGNVRQLENWIHRAFLLCKGDVIRFEDYSATGYADMPGEDACPGDGTPFPLRNFTIARREVIERFEKQYLHRLLRRTGGNITRAARIAHKERRNLGRLIKKHGIDRRQYNGGQ